MNIKKAIKTLSSIRFSLMKKLGNKRKYRWLTFLPKIYTSKNKTKIILPIAPIILGLIVVVILLSWIVWQQRQTTRTEAEMLATISEVIELPAEVPQIAVVSDASLLSQPFFAPAQNGDVVIVYQEAGKVLLYRPSSKKVVNFANIQIPRSEVDIFRHSQ